MSTVEYRQALQTAPPFHHAKPFCQHYQRQQEPGTVCFASSTSPPFCRIGPERSGQTVCALRRTPAVLAVWSPFEPRFVPK